MKAPFTGKKKCVLPFLRPIERPILPPFFFLLFLPFTSSFSYPTAREMPSLSRFSFLLLLPSPRPHRAIEFISIFFLLFFPFSFFFLFPNCPNRLMGKRNYDAYRFFAFFTFYLCHNLSLSHPMPLLTDSGYLN